MAAKKTIDQLEKEVQANITALSNKYVELMLEENEEGTDDTDIEKRKEDKKLLKSRLDQLKRDLKFINAMKGSKPDKKTERELARQQNEIINWVKKMPSSIGEIVKTIPKH